ncbi:hypothetical protein [Paeniglutamicibacter cryotolerans]|uniref:hypothetical protein n=1 Tax=Paeniglutamicibacter cryotolerans TaxID=670079 RepID=UPI0031E80D57
MAFRGVVFGAYLRDVPGSRDGVHQEQVGGAIVNGGRVAQGPAFASGQVPGGPGQRAADGVRGATRELRTVLLEGRRCYHPAGWAVIAIPVSVCPPVFATVVVQAIGTPGQRVVPLAGLGVTRSE